MSGGEARGYPPVIRKRRKWIYRLGWGVAAVVGVFLVLGIAVLLSLDSVIRWQVRTSLAHQIGTGVRLDSARLGLRDGSLELRSLVVSNPPGFGPAPLISVPELYLRYDAGAAASNRLKLAEVRLHLHELNVIIDSQGRTNLNQLVGHALGGGTSGTNRWPDLEFQGIDRLTLTLGRVSVIDQRDSRKNIVLNLDITNRTFTEVDSLLKLFPLLMEIGLRGGLEMGIPVLPVSTNAPSLR